MKMTINEIAKQAGVSKATVSRVLNQSKSVSEDVRSRVQGVIDVHNFKPSALARSLSIQKSHLIGIILPDLSNPVFSRMISGMESYIRDQDYSLLIMATDFKVENKISHIEIFKDKGVDGLILVTDHCTSALTEALRVFNKPTVIIGAETDIEHIPVIRIDNYSAAREATRYLINLGHKRIAMIRGPLDDPQSGGARFEGYRDVLMENNLYDERLVVQSWYAFDEGYHAMESLLRKEVMPTAVFCACDLIAIGAMKCAMVNGFSVPRQISFVGFDDVEIARMYTPTLTTVRQPFEQKGRLAVEKLIDKIENPSNEAHLNFERMVLDYQFVVRESARSIEDLKDM
jgi:LacI family transcriptional regulator